MTSAAMECVQTPEFAAPIPALPDRLLQVAGLWSAAQGATLHRLGALVINDGAFFARLESTASTTTKTLERFARFLIDPGNWPQGDVPAEVCRFAHAVGISGGACPALADDASEDSGSDNDFAMPGLSPIPGDGISGRPPELAAAAPGGPAAALTAQAYPPVAGAAAGEFQGGAGLHAPQSGTEGQQNHVA